MADWPDGIDMEALLRPITGENAAGIDLRADFSPQSPYYRLRDARAEARAAERAADANPGEDLPVPAQWRTVRDIALAALQEQTKDLELAAWLTEALMRSDGLIGLAAGARLLRGLCEQYWDGSLYPLPDEDGIPTRVAPVAGLNGEGGDGTLIQPLRKLALFKRPDGSPMAYWQYAQSAELKGIGDAARVKQRLAAGVMPFDQMEIEARAGGAEHFASLRRAVKAAASEWQTMSAIMDSKAAAEGPPTSRVRDLLAEILATVNKYAPPDLAEEETAETPEQAEEEEATGASVRGAVRAAPAVTREEMLGELARISDYFRKTEPQSPIAYTLEEAIRRGRMTWPDLLAELVSDAKARDAILTTLGIRPRTPEPEPPPPPAKK